MFRNLFPFILASLGVTLIVLARTMPFSEWQISYIRENFPTGYDKTDIDPLWTLGLGEDLLDYSSLSYRVLVGKGDGQYFERCPMGNLKFFIEYVQGDEALERVWRTANEIASWLVILGLIEIILSGIYMWWFTISREHRPISDAISFTLAAVVFCGILFFILQAAISPRISNDSLRWASECSGTITFYAKLSKIYYEPIPVYFVATLLELGALGVMLRQIIKALLGRNASSQSTVG